MKTRLNLSLLIFLLLGASSPSFAMMSVGNISKEQAKEMGLELRSRPGGTNHVWVELEFKTEGKLRDFHHVSLEISDGDNLLLGYAPLRERRSAKGGVIVGFLASRACLEKITLRIVAGLDAGYDVRVKDFVELEKLH